ncbi:putative peptidoglycan muropeptide transporter SLC46 [Haematobia irritans]|uniref:putative peptidoglycan muropeptide transporter SLC46 n=1 Tax=Haematobia irritans TaxID=7368 RepID=UPI003F502F62
MAQILDNLSLNNAIGQTKHRWFILEPAVFLVFLSTSLSGTIYQNLLLHQTCTAVFHYNDTQCKPFLGMEEGPEGTKLTNSQENILIEIQKYVSNILMAQSILESIIPAILSLFIGPWSDKFGRRPIVLATFMGYAASAVVLNVLCYITTTSNISSWMILLSSVPLALSGGHCALLTGIYCYISDVADEKTRPFRMVLNEVSLSLGVVIGNVSSSYLYAATNALTIFTISTALTSLALGYCLVFVKESLQNQETDCRSKIREFFRFDLVRDLFRTCLKKRSNYDRAIIWLTLMALTLAIFAVEGDSNVSYMFVSNKFEWNVREFGIYSASRIIVQIIGSALGMLLLKELLNFSIVSMNMLAYGSSILECTCRAIAPYSWVLYIGVAMGCMRGILGPMSRAIHSHLTPPSEVGKIFALTTSMESFSPILAAPIYTSIYRATLTWYAGMFNFISTTLYLLGFTFMVVIFGLHKHKGKSSTYADICG